MRVEFVAEIERGEMAHGDEIIEQSGNVAVVEIFKDTVAIMRSFDVPGDIGGPKMRNRREHVIGAVSGWSQAVVRHRRCMQVEREVIRQGVALEDLVNELARSEEHTSELQS